MDLRYPIGELHLKEEINKNDIEQWISEIEKAPDKLSEAVSGLTEEQIDSPYRPDGWTVRQVVHHIADSHINGYIRFKLGLTEEQPTIKPYDEASWAKLNDSNLPIEVSITLISSLHKRLVNLLKSFNENDFSKTVNHPENGTMTLAQLIATYAWHGNHHIAHITSLRERMGWVC
jgi:uncharacterized damage-inducible protein DinB